MLQQKKTRNSSWKKLLTAAVLLLAICLRGFSQVTVSGTVNDRETGKPMPGAHITVENTFISVASANDGKYRVRVLKTGTWTMKVTFMGYQAIAKTFRLVHDTVIDYKMVTSAILGEEVNIIATRAQEKTPTTYSMMSHTEIKKNNLGQDLPFIIENTDR